MALSLNLSHISYTYPASPESAIHDLSASFAPGWTGIVGVNGCGKSTLARIACSLLEPDAGFVSPKLSSTYCEQDPHTPPDALFDFACDYSRDARRLRDMLRLDEEMFWRFSELSCGEQKKIQVAAALWMQPEVLAIDEPTNHVDAVCRKELQAALAEYRGIGLLISHDRVLLDALVSQCLCFEGANAVMRRGSYTQSHAREQEERRSAEHARKQAKSTLAKLSAEEERRKRIAAKTAGRLSARNLDKHDSDGRARRSLAKVSGQDGKTGLLASRMGRRVHEAAKALDENRTVKRYEGDLWFDARPCPRKTLVRIEECAIPCGERTLHIPELVIGNTDRIGIRGPNGAGKSTLVRHIMATLARNPYNDFETMFIAQELPETQNARVMDEVKHASDAERGRVLSFVAQLDSDPKRVLSGGVSSPGEMRKLLIARGILSSPAIIVMDEPTNHLDIHTIEALERALEGFPGTLILVSHDEAFLAATCETSIDLETRGNETFCTVSRR